MSWFQDSTSNHASQHVNSEKHDEYRRGHEHIAKNLADLMRAGKSIDDVDVQHWIGKHYEYVCQFWTPTKIAYKSLALTYVMDPAFKATYDAFEPGLAKYIQIAINIWAEANLE